MAELFRACSVALMVFSVQASPAGTGVIAGQVVNAVTGKPVSGATVTLSTGAPPPASPNVALPATARRAVAVANSEGRFVFRDVPEGTYSLSSTLEGHAPGASGRRRANGAGRAFTLANGARITDARLLMWPLSTISGHVRDDRGEPAIGVPVTAMRRVTNGGRDEFTFAGGTGEATDDRGYYRLSNLMPGSYVLVIRTTLQSMSAAAADAYRAAVTSGTTASLTAQYRATGVVQISGRGLDIGGWIINSLSDDPRILPGPNGTVLTPPLTFYPNARTPDQATVITLGSGDDRSGIDLTLPMVAGVRVSGTLMGPDGPAVNHGVRLIPASSAEPIYEIPLAYGVTDANGRFALIGVAPGSYILRSYRVTPNLAIMRPDPPAPGGLAGATGSPAAPPTPTPSLFAELPVIVGNAHIDNLSLRLAPGARISGRVVIDAPTPTGATPPRITMNIRSLGTPLITSTEAVVDPNGRFSFMGYAPGRYEFAAAIAPPSPPLSVLSMIAGGVDIADKVLTLGTTDIPDVVVTLTDKTQTISGTVRTSDANTDPEGTVVLFPVDVPAWINAGMSSRRVATSVVSTSGTYRLSVPLPGEYLLVAVPADVDAEVTIAFAKRFAALATRVSVALGESRSQDLTIARIK